MAVLLDSVGGVSENPNSVGWIRTPYGIRISEDPANAFHCIKDAMDYALAKDGNPEYNKEYADLKKSVDDWNKSVDKGVVTAYSQYSEGDGLIGGKTFYTAFNYTDTRIGGNDAINPYWQFNRDDDITPPMFEIGGSAANGRGMGRVYAETYEANQVVLWLQMGVPEYANLIELFSNSGNADAMKAMTQGSLASLGTKICTLVIKGALWLITFPITAPFFAIKWLSSLASNDITKFYRFRPAMPMYFDMVNSMLAYLAVGMGIYPQYLIDRRNSFKRLEEDFSKLAGDDKDKNIAKYRDQVLEDASEAKYNESSIPNVLLEGPDILKILNRRKRNYDSGATKVSARELLIETASAMGQNGKAGAGVNEAPAHITTRVRTDADGNQMYTDSATDKAKSSTGVLARYYSYLKSSLLGAFDFVGFRCEKGLNTSESVSNSTMESPLFSRVNEYAKSKQQETVGDSFLGSVLFRLSTGTSADSLIKQELTKAGLKFAEAIGIGAAGSILSTGNGFFEVPEMWHNSSFSKQTSFNIQLRARYGDPVTIYQSVYIPLLMLIAAACPRSVGDNMYTSPFLVKAFCKGKFSVACGIITELSITRGKDEFGWSDTELPTAIDVQLTIKDLSPVMYMAMQDIGLFDTFKRNENMMEYLDTLSSLGIYERMYELPRMMRKLSAAILVKKNTIFSPEWWGLRTAKTRLGMAFSALNPWGGLHEKADYVSK